MSRIKWTKDRVLREWQQQDDSANYTLEFLDDIVNSRSKIKVTCGYNHTFFPSVEKYFGRKTRCPVCNGCQRWSNERLYKEFKEDNSLAGYKLDLTEEITSNESRFFLTCPKNHRYESSVRNFHHSRTRCKICSGRAQWTEEAILKYIEDEKLNFTVEFTSNIKNNKTIFNVTCQNGHTFKSNPVVLTHHKSRCRICNCRELWNKERVMREFEKTKDKSKFNLEIPYEVTGNNTKIRITCKKQHTWEVTIKSYFQHKRRCPTCNESHGEKIIAWFLETNNVDFHREKKFDDCKNINSLPFDFYLPEYNILCEFHGSQHFKKANFSNDDLKNITNFEQIQKRDEIKKQWAIANGYNFLEIRYDQINQIEEILTQELNL